MENNEQEKTQRNHCRDCNGAFLLLNGLDIQFKHNAREWVREVVAHPAYKPACWVLFSIALAAWIVYWVLVYREKKIR